MKSQSNLISMSVIKPHAIQSMLINHVISLFILYFIMLLKYYFILFSYKDLYRSPQLNLWPS